MLSERLTHCEAKPASCRGLGFNVLGPYQAVTLPLLAGNSLNVRLSFFTYQLIAIRKLRRADAGARKPERQNKQWPQLSHRRNQQS
jgi:hypothetical protein